MRSVEKGFKQHRIKNIESEGIENIGGDGKMANAAAMDWKNKAIDFLGYGLGLWLLGFTLGMLFFSFVPANLLGIPILLIMTPVAIYATLKRFKNSGHSATYYALVGLTWLAIALILDYFLLVKAFNVQNYYDFDLMVYYALTFLIPVGVGLKYGSRKTGK